jgi:tRNA 2-thiouridine synthesizing protein C
VAAQGSKSTLIVIRHSPYGSALARASLDVVLANAAFEQPVDLLFVGDGVLQLLPGQDTSAIGTRNMARQIAALPLYDIHHVYVDARAAADYQLNQASSAVALRLLDASAMQQLMVAYDHLLSL